MKLKKILKLENFSRDPRDDSKSYKKTNEPVAGILERKKD